MAPIPGVAAALPRRGRCHGEERRGGGGHGCPERRREIVEAAMRVFAEQGFSAPLEAVAREAGVSKSLVLWYFGSKSALLREVVEKALPVDVVEACVYQGLAGAELLRCIARRYLEKYRSREMRHLLLRVMAEREAAPGGVEELCGRLLAEIARAAYGSNGAREKVRVRMFFGALLCYALNPPSDTSPEEFIETLVEEATR